MQVQGSMTSNDKFKAACTAKHPNLRPVCDSSSGYGDAVWLDSTGKQRCIQVPDGGTGRRWSVWAHNGQNGMSSTFGHSGVANIYWSTGGESTLPYKSLGAYSTSFRRARPTDENGYIPTSTAQTLPKRHCSFEVEGTVSAQIEQQGHLLTRPKLSISPKLLTN